MTRITNLLFLLLAGTICTNLSGQVTLVHPLNTVSNGSILSGENLVANGLYYVTATDGTHGFELWRSDGTTAGTFMLKDINPDPNSLDAPFRFMKLGNKVLFMANDGVHGYELWVTDGSSDSTKLVKDIQPGDQGVSISWGGVVKDKLYLAISTSDLGQELWVTDGTGEGTKLVKDIAPDFVSGIVNYEPAIYNDHIFFGGQDADYEPELWVSDGTEAGTHLLKDIGSGIQNSMDYSDYLVGTPIGVFFTANDGVHGRELWFTDGTEAGTHLVRDINPSAEIDVSSVRISPDYHNFEYYNGKFYFIANDGSSVGEQLWATDGTEAGTAKIKLFDNDFANSPTERLTAAPQGIFFRTTETNTGHELYITDGTTAGTKLVKDIVAGPDPGVSGVTKLALAGNRVYFTAGNYFIGKGYEIWSSDGTEAGTALAFDVNPGTESSFPSAYNILGDQLMFAATKGNISQGLFKATVNTVSAHELALASEALFRVDPQPASARVRIAARDAAQKLDRVVLVYPNGAQTLYYDGAAIGVYDLDCSTLPNGVYAVLVSAGGKLSSEKLMVQH